MKDEIKEILDELNKNKEEIRHYEYYPDDVLNCEDLIKLLDYITNLQEEIKEKKLLKELYQLRNEKAINYIEKHKRHEYRNGNDNEYYLELDEDKLKELTNILQGSDKNEKGN